MNSDKRSLLQFLVVIAAILVYCNWNAIVDGNVDGRMHQGLAANTDGGTKIVAYYVDEDRYSKDFVPFVYQTSNPDDVGAILQITKERISRTYSGGFQVYADRLYLQLIDSRTGEVINGMGVSPMFPDRYRTGSRVTVDEDYVKRWVTKQWDAYLAENK